MHLKRMLRTAGAIVMVAGLVTATAARAESLIVGTVIDAETKKPLLDVIITATSPALQGEQVVVTDAQGQYRIPELPPGVYTLRFDKELYRPATRAEFSLRMDHTVHVNMELLGEDLELESWACWPPVIDVGSTTTGTSIRPASVQRLALNRPTDKGGASRSFESLADLAPGARSETYGVSINGATPFENAYRVDGLSTNDPVLGVNALPLSVEFLQEVEVITGGYMPEHGRATGGVLRALTRSGGSELHGSVFGNWVPGALGGIPTPASGPTWTISGQNAIQNQGELGATLGGPLLKDRLWFFAGVAPAFTQVEHTRTLNTSAPGPDGTLVSTPIPGTSRFFLARERGLQAMGKLTYLLNTDHNVTLSVLTTPTRSGGDGFLTVDRWTGRVQEYVNGTPESATLRMLDGNFSMAALHYDGAFMDKRMLVDARFGWTHQTSSDLPIEGAGLYSVYRQRRPVTFYEPASEAARYCGADSSEGISRCPVTYYEAGEEDTFSLSTLDRYQANAQAMGFVDFIGTHVLKAGVDAEHLTSEQAWGEGDASAFSMQPGNASTLLGGFVQDSWTFANRFTLNAGLRYDAQWLYTPEGDLAFALDKQLSPRVGLIIGPLARGSMKFFAHYAKYRRPLSFPLTSLASFVSPRNGPVDPGLALPSSTELVAGAEFEVLFRTRLSATYTHRSLDSVVASLTRDEGVTLFPGNPGAGFASDFPKAERTHDAVTVALSHTFFTGWLAQASYTWSRLYGNYAGPAQLATAWGDEAGFKADDSIAFRLKNRTGLLPNDRTHDIKVFGARQFHFTRALSASIGLSYRGRSGTPINYLGADPLLGMGESFVLPRGSSGERTPWAHVIDSNVGVSYRLGGNKAVSLTLEAFNLFNFQAVTRVNEHYTYASVLPLETPVEPGTLTPEMVRTPYGGQLSASGVDPEFKKPIQYQAPRQVRLGLRYTF